MASWALAGELPVAPGAKEEDTPRRHGGTEANLGDGGGSTGGGFKVRSERVGVEDLGHWRGRCQWHPEDGGRWPPYMGKIRGFLLGTVNSYGGRRAMGDGGRGDGVAPHSGQRSGVARRS